VGSTNNTDKVSNFSNYGWGVDVLAPGEQILSTFPGNKYQGFDGTSFSCPLTAGVAALIKTLHPTWTPQMIRQQITSTNVKAASITLYTVQVNTGNDPLSTLLKNCASSTDKFFLLTSADQMVATFNQIGTALSNLRVAQ
jgi:subtilisin family serine protease